MSVQVDTGTTHLLAAATAAAGLIPSPHPLTVSPDDGSRPEGDSVAYLAAFTGAVSGTVILVLHPDIAAALTAGAPGLEVADAVRPALEAAAASTGPNVLGQVSTAPVDDVAPIGGRAEVVALTGGGMDLAWLGLILADGSEPATRATAAGGALGALGLNLLRDVEMVLSVEIGRARMTVRDLLQLVPGSVVELDRTAGAPADLLVNGRLIARGEVVVVDEDFGLRITELVQPAGENLH